jgi:hypothetical protein
MSELCHKRTHPPQHIGISIQSSAHPSNVGMVVIICTYTFRVSERSSNFTGMPLTLLGALLSNIPAI